MNIIPADWDRSSAALAVLNHALAADKVGVTANNFTLVGNDQDHRRINSDTRNRPSTLTDKINLGGIRTFTMSISRKASFFQTAAENISHGRDRFDGHARATDRG